jgi:hypothetical protein
LTSRSNEVQRGRPIPLHYYTSSIPRINTRITITMATTAEGVASGDWTYIDSDGETFKVTSDKKSKVYFMHLIISCDLEKAVR